MSVSPEAVSTLRHEVEAMLRDGIGTEAATVPFETVAESLGYLVHVLRTDGMNEDEIADEVELAARAIEIDQQELRAARDVLRSLQYPDVLVKRLTAVARKAKPAPPPRWANRRGDGAGHAPCRPPTPATRPSEADRALAELRAPRKRQARR